MKVNKLLLIEDDTTKIEDIKSLLKDKFKYNELVVKESYQSGMREVLAGDYNLLLLDMSIPTWDKAPNTSNSSFEKFGGYRILREVIRKGKPIKTILITMFDDFGESDHSITLSQIDNGLKNEFGDIYLGYVFYSSDESSWQENLSKLIVDSFK